VTASASSIDGSSILVTGGTGSFGACRFRSIPACGEGVCGQIGGGQAPARRRFQHREEVNGFIKLDRRAPFCPGDKIRILDGAFSSCLGLFEGMAESERIAILLDLLGRKVRVVLDADLVAAA
jgi:transcriptional antiterminator RfaH